MRIIPTEDIHCSDIEDTRGGVLDAIMTRLSFGYLGVKTKVIFGWRDEISGEYYPPNITPTQVVFGLGREVVVLHGLDGKTVISRRIVRNRK